MTNNDDQTDLSEDENRHLGNIRYEKLRYLRRQTLKWLIIGCLGLLAISLQAFLGLNDAIVYTIVGFILGVAFTHLMRLDELYSNWKK